MVSRLSIIVLGCSITLFLSGCTGSSKTQLVSFEPFSLEIPETFQSIPTGIVENKQILHKVIKSFKLPSQEGSFSPNLVVTSTLVPPSFDYEQFWSANTSKIQQDLQGYEPGKKEIVTFDCGEARVQGILTTFQITDTFTTQLQTYYMSQYQRVWNEKGYIISYATGHPDDQSLLSKRLPTLHCL